MYNEQKQLFNWRQVRRNKQELNLCTRILISGLLVSAAGAVNAGVAPAPTTTPICATNCGGVTQGNDTIVNQTQQRELFTWSNFDTTSSQSVTFNQPGRTSVAINQILGSRINVDGRTLFDGALNANGRVFLINNNGITFGANAQVNVGSLLATTADFDAAEIHSGTLDFSTSDHASIINNGHITITERGGIAALLAPYIENTGTIETSARGSRVLLASSRTFSVDMTDNRPQDAISFSKSRERAIDGGEGAPSGVDNSGTLRARSGFIRLLNTLVDANVNVGGELDADQFEPGRRGGTILVESKGSLNFDGAEIHAVGGDSVRGKFTARGDITSNSENGPSSFRFESARDVEGTSSTASVLFRSRKGSLTLDGDVRVAANADEASYSGTATASLIYRAEQDITLTGDSTVVANARDVGSQSNWYTNANADASLSIYTGHSEESDSNYGGTLWVPGGDILIDGDLSAEANANTEPGYDGSYGGQARADASIAVSTLDDAGSYFSFYGYGGEALDAGDVTHRGDSSVQASASGGQNNQANADLRVTGEHLAIFGDEISVTAESEDLDGSGSYGGYYYDQSYSDANANFYARGNDLANGDAALRFDSDLVVNSRLQSSNGNRYYYSNWSDASAYLWSNDSLSHQGNITSSAENTYSGSSYTYSYAWSAIYLGTQSGDLTSSGDIDSGANVDAPTGYASASANFSLDAGEGYFWRDLDPQQLAELQSSAPSLRFTGDATAEAHAQSESGQARSYSYGRMAATGDTRIDAGEVDVSSLAEGADADSNAYLNLSAGIGGDGGEGEIQLLRQGPSGGIEIDGDLDVTGAVASHAQSVGSDGGEGVPNANAFTSLIATGSTRISGPNPLAEANSARVQGMSTAWQECDGEDCTPVTPGISRGRPQFAQLIIEGTEGTPLALELLNGYRGPNQPSPGFGGTQGLRFGPSGDMQPATAAGLTLPPGGPVGNAEEILAAGGDPSKQLPPTAAGPGSDDDFCGQLVNGGCSGN